MVNGAVEKTPSCLVTEDDIISLNIKKDETWVSRGAYKLHKALIYYNIDLTNKVCIDIGCSTGGFTQVMLEYGAKKVFAVDVGTNQFDRSLLCDRVKLMEKTHFCTTQITDFGVVDFIACDVSFISATRIIEHVAKLFNYPFDMICLIKPQFELTKEILDKCKGIIPEKYHKQAISRVCSCANQNGFLISEVIESPILGAKAQNKEYLVHLRRF
ncbi:MAG: TlyA family RNA methyltransferase [Mycoplasmoidaceae bacterium]|nr:TlyA family RNA methyltransferase [Mycoplasmoidaceae bacterium]